MSLRLHHSHPPRGAIITLHQGKARWEYEILKVAINERSFRSEKGREPKNLKIKSGQIGLHKCIFDYSKRKCNLLLKISRS
jgi:hypothetical protein